MPALQIRPRPTASARYLGHVTAVCYFIALAVWSTWPLGMRLADAVPGRGAGDNVAFLWNFWWFRSALAHRSLVDVFHTDVLFAPIGTQLALHTSSLLHSIAATLLLPVVDPVAAYNLALLGALVANGLVTYGLAFRLTRSWLASLCGGAMFAGSAYVQSHLLGHTNLVHAWVLPLFVWSVLPLARQPRRLDGIRVGVAAAVALYADLYYAVFVAVIAVIAHLTLGLRMTFGVRRLRTTLPVLRRALLILIAAAGAAAVVIGFSGGGRIDLGPLALSLRSVRNPLAIVWCAAIVRLLLVWRPVISVRQGARELRSVWLIAGLTSLILVAPVVAALAGVILRGDYTAQRVLWQSSPPGIDALSFMLGNPRNAFAGDATQEVLRRLQIDDVEQVGWLGVAAILVFARRWSSRLHESEAGFFVLMLVAGVVLALGPFLRFGGFDTGLLLPDAFLRYVPPFTNARIPGRAIILAQLSVCVAVTCWLVDQRRRRILSVAVVSLVLLDSLPAPVSLYPLPAADNVDRQLAVASVGTVAELPTGLRDGFGESGHFDHRALIHQTHHGRPLLGGFVARLSPTVRSVYDQSPLWKVFIDISEGRPGFGSVSSTAARRDLDRFDLRYIVLNTDALENPEQAAADVQRLGFRLSSSSPGRALYVREEG
jgi:hypothetical protein